MIIKFSKTFKKQRNKAPIKIQKAFDEKLKLFLNDYSNPSLNLHRLNGVLKNYHSINITGDWRSILRFTNKKEIVVFLMLGTHSKLYK